jgi:hypothetical protein
MTVDFRQLLNRPTDDIKRPKPLPAGTYHGLVKSYEFGESAQKKTPYVRFALTLNSAGDDVDQEELAEIELSSKQLSTDFYLTDNSLYRLKEFLESVGVATEGRSLGECIPDSVNVSVIIDVTQDLNQKDPSAPPYNNVKSIKGED